MAETQSLLWRSTHTPTHALDLHVITDLNLNTLIRHLSLGPQHERITRHVLMALTTDADTIRYRQSILDDVLRSPRLLMQLEAALETIEALESYLGQPQWRETLLQQVAWRLSELEHYARCVTLLAGLLDEADEALQSEGLRHLRTDLHAITQSESFVRLQAELPELLGQIRGVASITIGINLDEEMRPTTAMLVSIHKQRFVEDTFISRLFGKRSSSTPEAQTGIGRLHNSRDLNMGGAKFEVELTKLDSPFMPPLFRDLALLMEDTSRPIAAALKQYMHIQTQFLIAMKSELAFYLGAARLVQAVRSAGLPLCQPDILPMPAREGHLEGMYNLNLALQLRGRHPSLDAVLVRNDVRFDDEGRIFILTGPNQGGKTTYTQGVGLAQVLFQAGLPVPATSARMSPVDGIYTHFATEERPDLEAGRLGEEARRLHHIFEQATPHSLILLNESLASTSLTEGLHLAQDVVRVMRVLGARAVFATHLHDLALLCDALNASTPGDSLLISLVSVAEVDHDPEGDMIRRTYRILRGAPPGKSYAVELAARYGISYDQLTALLQQRRVVS